ncbi:magnesium transporter [Amorphus orientalis]|uniref:Magnesium transporter MgtE n=1 Tax=Amorphus orientalis TaxID=649198 RepID=A0AAE4ATE2_9HYPH|nr:magnesium transporter [Amorphus orientalis]MDQ0316183.1 magnesium transporter [Amorphus orientalis]
MVEFDVKTVDPYKQIEPIRAALETDDRKTLATITKHFRAGDFSEIIENLSRTQAAQLFPVIRKELRADVFGRISFVHQNYILRSVPLDQALELIRQVPEEDIALLLRKMPRTRARTIYEELTELDPEIGRQLLHYDRDEVGRWISYTFLTAAPADTPRAIYERLRARTPRSHPVVSIYVVDQENRLIDRLELEELVRIEATDPIEKLLDREVTSLQASDSVETAIHRFQVRDAVEMPVVDADNRLIGLIRADDILHLTQDAFSDTMQKMGGVSNFDTPYMMTSVFQQVRKRGGWLAILFLGEMLTATALTYYEAELDQAVVLALFLPLILSSGGNSGSQSSTLIIRALAVKECNLSDWFRIFRREIVTGLILGALLCLVATARITLWDVLGWADYTEHGKFSPELVTFTVAIGVLGIVTWGNVVGSLLPLGIRAVRLDPAVISAPLLATFVDVTGLMIYFTAARYILDLA